jgi:hypothetical protein
MKGLIVRSLPILLGLVLAGRADGRGLLVSPSQVGLAGEPGTTVSETIYVSSSREEKNFVQVGISDFTRDENGQVREIAAAGAPRSCREWLEVDRMNFTSPEQGRIQLTVRGRIPQGAAGSYWALVTLKSIPPPRQGGSGHGFRVVPRVAIPVIITALSGEERTMKISELKVVSATPRELSVEAILENHGNVAVLFNGAFTLNSTDANGRLTELAEAPVDMAMSLPGTRSRVRGTIAWDGTLDGLRLQSIFRFGPDQKDIVEAGVNVDAERIDESS